MRFINYFFLFQEKTNAVRALAQQTQAARLAIATLSSTAATPEELSNPGHYPKLKENCLHGSGIPQATLDLSGVAHELSTLV